MRDTDALMKKMRELVRDVPDFPKPGIRFKDITPLLADPEAFAGATAAMAAPFRNASIDHVVGIESRGFILGACVARELGVGFVPVRKPGKLPGDKRSIEYALEYGTDRLEVHADVCRDTDQVLVVDDVLATGGTARATCLLLEQVGARVIGLSFLMTLDFLKGREKLQSYRVETVLRF